MTQNNLQGLNFLNCELSSRCNKKCTCCGRRKMEHEHPEKCDWGDMPFEMVKKIANQLPEGIVVAFHSNGESTMYPQLGEALSLFQKQIRCMDTNGKLLLNKCTQLINNLDTLTISVIENDPEGDEQYEIVKDFLAAKGTLKPRMVYRLLGDVKDPQRWHDLPGMIVTRILHKPEGSFGYTKKVTRPEIGFCLECISHLVIDRRGNCFPCVRMNPDNLNCLGNINEKSLEEIWNNPLRKKIIQMHVDGKRSEIPLCNKCDFYGCPTEKGD